MRRRADIGRGRNGRRAAGAALLLFASAGARGVDFPGPVRWDGAVTVASETVRRGITWSGGRASVAAELSATTDQGWRATLGADAPAYPQTGARFEWTVGAARSWQIDADWSAEASLTRYSLVGPRAARQAGYAELGLTAGWRGQAFFGVTLSPAKRSFDIERRDFRNGNQAAADLGLTQRLAGRLSLDAGIGYATVATDQRRGYAYGSIGLRWSVGPVQAQLGKVASQAARRGVAPSDQAGSRVLASASLAF